MELLGETLQPAAYADATSIPEPGYLSRLARLAAAEPQPVAPAARAEDAARPDDDEGPTSSTRLADDEGPQNLPDAVHTLAGPERAKEHGVSHAHLPEPNSEDVQIHGDVSPNPSGKGFGSSTSMPATLPSADVTC